jgi:hypothetical protein
MNYQYKHGCSLTVAFKVLYDQGGVRRFYSGYSIAVFQAPLGRFFDTAANSALALFALYPAFDSVPIFVKTMAASATAASFKVSCVRPPASCAPWIISAPLQMLLFPLDAFKTMMQVEGNVGIRILLSKLKEHGILALWDGAAVAALSMIATHYPWYLSFNYLNAIIPRQARPWR